MYFGNLPWRVRTSGHLSPGPQKATVAGAVNHRPSTQGMCSQFATVPKRPTFLQFWPPHTLIVFISQAGASGTVNVQTHIHMHCCFVTQVFPSPGVKDSETIHPTSFFKCCLPSTMSTTYKTRGVTHCLQSEIHWLEERSKGNGKSEPQTWVQMSMWTLACAFFQASVSPLLLYPSLKAPET